MYGYIYITTNKVNGKKYIGQHKSLDGSLDENYLGSGNNIRKAVKKYGKQNFECKILETVDSLDEANEKEKFYIQQYNAVNDDMFYNIAAGGNSLGHKKGEPSWNSGLTMNDPRVKANVEKATKTKREKHIPSWAKGLTKETDERVARMSHPCSDFCKKRISESLKGKPSKLRGTHLSEETKKKLSDSKKGKKKSKEHVEKMRQRALGNEYAKRCQVMCVETNQVFPSMAEAARRCGLKTYTQISLCTRNPEKTSGGYHWKLVEESE